MQLVMEYVIKPLAHVQLLNGQKRIGCTRDLLTDSYYCFTYQKKEEDSPETFLCGTYAANHLLELLNHPKLPIFDPLVSENATIVTNRTNGSKDSEEMWHPATKQLDNAINLLVICWGIAPGNSLQDIKGKLEKYKNQEPFHRQIKSLNTIISKDKRNRTLQQIIDDLRKQK